MKHDPTLAITSMLNSFPLGSNDPDLLLGSFERAAKDYDADIIGDAARRFETGIVEGQSTDFAPSVARWAEELRRLADLRSYQDKPRLQRPARRSGGPAPFEINQEKYRQKYADWTVLHEDVSYEKWRTLQRDLPVGAVWCAALGTIFMPPQKKQTVE